MTSFSKAEKRRQFAAGAPKRVEAIADMWARLLTEGATSDADNTARDLHRELLTLKVESSELDLSELHLVCQRVEELVVLAHRRRYNVPEEMTLTVSMAMEFIGFLVSDDGSGTTATADVAGFVAQLDAVLQEAESLPSKERSPSHDRTIPSASPAARYADERTDHLTQATRCRLARIATEIFLESLRADRASTLRLRETWQLLQQELTRLGRVRLQERILPHARDIASIDREKIISLTSEIAENAVVSPEIGDVLDLALRHLIDNAVVHGIELPTIRLEKGKTREGNLRIEARINDGAVTLTVEDDGAGVDASAITRAAISAGVVSANEAETHVGGSCEEETRRAVSLMFEPAVTTTPRGLPPRSSSLLPPPGTGGGGGGAMMSGHGLTVVRDAVRRMNGTVNVRSQRDRGTSVTVTIPEATTNVEVRTFRASAGQLLLAVESSWMVGGPPPRGIEPTKVDPLQGIGLGGQRGLSVPRLQQVLFKRGNRAYEVPTRSTPVLTVASRLGPPDPAAPVEVVLVGTTEALLIRLDQIVAKMSQSTVPPPASRPPPGAPPKPAEEPMPKEATRTSSGLRRGPQRVLLVDPDHTWLVLTRSALVHRGFAVQAVSTFADLTEGLLKWGPDVLLGDVVAMEKPAIDVCRHIKKLRPLLPVILFSDGNLEQIEKLVRDSVADVSLSKTVGPDQLATEIRLRCGNAPV